MYLNQWPADRPYPTDPQITAARMRYKADLLPEDFTDWVCGLEFVMATYARELWWHYFFPEEKMEFKPCSDETFMALLNARRPS